MENKRDAVYMVTYRDDAKRKHMTFVKDFSTVKFLEDRFGTLDIQVTKNYDKDSLRREYY